MPLNRIPTDPSQPLLAGTPAIDSTSSEVVGPSTLIGQAELSSQVELSYRVDASYSPQIAWAIGVLAVLIFAAVRWSWGVAEATAESGRVQQLGDEVDFRVDVNTATAAELRALPDFGATLASRIVEYRNSHGEFAIFQELSRVRGVGPKTLARLESMLIVNPQRTICPLPSGADVLTKAVD